MIKSPWENLSHRDRVTAVNIDIMNHIDFCTLSGLVVMGDVIFKDDMPTAATDGKNVYYGTQFIEGLNRKQLRFVQLHESMHKALKHCVDYKRIAEKYPKLINVAMDYVVNAFLEQTDPAHKFFEHPAWPKLLLDKKYYNMSVLDVLSDLIKQEEGQQQQQQQQSGDGQGQGQGNTDETLDEHMPGTDDIEEADALRKDVEDALNHGDMVQKRMAAAAGMSGGGNPLSGMGVKRTTDWRGALRAWIESVCEGYEYSRYNPPNRRLMAIDILMPSHFDVAAGELAILCDTSGSMDWIYPVVFGEIANIAKQANPERVRLIWWDTRVRGEQVFKRGSYDTIAKQLKPIGGGGTTPTCVAQYMAEKRYKITGAIWLTDGDLDACPTRICSNELWGVVNNDSFKPAHGKVLRIHS